MKFIFFLGFFVISIIFNTCTITQVKTDASYTWTKNDSLNPDKAFNSLAQRSNVPSLELKQYNDIYEIADLSPGQLIRIPQKTNITPADKESIKKLVFSWPSEGKISSPFGPRRRRHHDGIDIISNKGLTIRAAAKGVVIFSGVKKGYGKTIIIQHANSVKTLYAHNAKNHSAHGETVDQGQNIATMGTTGNSTGVHLHFEIKYNGKALDPLKYLPQRPR